MTSSGLFRHFARFVVFPAFLCATLLSQQAPAPPPTGGQGGGNTGGIGGSNQGGRPGTDPGGQQRPGQPQMPGRDQRDTFPEMQNRPVFLSGKVVMDDGTPPPDSVTIERVCGGVVRPEAYTDSKGRFSFQLGQNQHMMADASIGSAADSMSSGPLMGNRGGMMSPTRGGIGERDLMGCELRATLAGFRSEVVNLSGRRALDNPDVGTIVMHRMAKVEGFTFSGTTAFAPKDAKKAHEKGMKAAKKKNWAEAEEQLQKAVGVYPKFAAAWYDLGAVYQQQSKLEEARKAYLSSIQADEKYVTPYAQLARISGAEQKWPDVAEYTSKVIRLNPYFSPEIYYISAVANFNTGKFEQAEEHAREASKMDAQHRNPRINHLLGVILAQKQAYPEAAENMRVFLKVVPEGPDAENVKKQLAEVERRMGNAGPVAGQQAQ